LKGTNLFIVLMIGKEILVLIRDGLKSYNICSLGINVFGCLEIWSQRMAPVVKEL
jgi:hypothetical protein